MKTTRTATRLGVLALAVWAVAALTPTAVLNSPVAPLSLVPDSKAGDFLARYCNPGVAGATGIPGWGAADFAGPPSGPWNQCPSGLVLHRSGGNGNEINFSSPGVDQSTMQYVKADFWSYSTAQGGSANLAKFCSVWSTNLCPIAGPASDGNGYRVLGSGGANGVTVPVTLNANNGQYFRLELTGGAGTNAMIDIWSIDFTVRDNSGPGAVHSGGTLQHGSAWNSGSKTLTYNTSDTGSGVERMTFGTDGGAQSTNDPNPGCARVAGGYASVYPCTGAYGASRTIDTTSLADGSHTWQATVYDASGNAAAVAPGTFKVDNTDPAEPDLLDLAGDNANGWQSGNDFDLSWQNDGEVAQTATQSGISQSCYDVNPGEGQATNPMPVCVNGAISNLSDIQVPEDGVWNTQVWTVDRAGNASDKATEVMRLDTTTPEKTPGFANGWVGLDELVTGKYQLWSRPFNYTAVNSEICGYGFSVTANEGDEAPTTVNVVGDVTQAQIPAGTPEGISWAHFRPISCAGLYGPTENVQVKVDLTNPQATVTGAPASGWTNSPGTISVAGTDHLPGSGMDPAPVGGSVVEGASVRFDLDGVTAKEDRGGTGSFDSSSLAEGAHTLTVKTFDVARNYNEQTFSIGVDKTPPSGAFAGSDPGDPTVFKVPVSDTLAGVVGGQVQYAALDGNGNEGTFKPMATKYENGELVGVFPDTKLPQGQYALRAVVQDGATNEGYVTKNVHGNRMVITNPLRDIVGLAFSATKNGKACKRKKAKTKAGKRKAAKLYKACKKKLAKGKGTDIQVGVRYGRALMLYGQLVNKNGQPIANQHIELYQQRAGDSLRLVGSATTDYAGQFAYKAPGGTSRRVVAYWPGTKTQQDVSASVRLGVATKVSLRVSPKVVRGARSFTFKGKVYTQDGVSAEGKLVQLQFFNYLRKKWQAGPALIRAGKGGNFKYKYRIKRGTAAKEKIKFRAFVPGESSWAYDAGTSRVQTIIHKR